MRSNIKKREIKTPSGYGAVEKQKNTTKKGIKLTIKMSKAGACKDVLSQRLLIATFEDLVKPPIQHRRYRVQKRY